VDWRVFPAGTATFHVEQVANMEHVIATGESIGAVNLLQSRHWLFHEFCQAAPGGQAAANQHAAIF
jgi:hypothetical protein